jgi:beta-lactam-binding protein with PASTA domain
MVNGREMTDSTKVEMPRGSGITLRVSYTSDNSTVIVPTVVGLSLSEARRTLWEMGLNVGDISYDKSVDMSDRRQTKVSMQSVGPERVVPYGEVISLSLSADTKEISRMMEATAEQAKINIKWRHTEQAIMRAKAQIAEDIERRRVEDEQRPLNSYEMANRALFQGYDDQEYSLPEIDYSEDEESYFF